ncbi:MAG: hypothetical protein K9M75_12565 [Phycisphaerae bacterium]|nr:hypothetical protein [Phycisphaerae bacterium]
MDFSRIISELENATSFELYRLSVAINKELENPIRIEKAKSLIKKGDIISYFESSENRLIEAKVLEIKRTQLHVRNKHDMKLWIIPFHMVNIEDIDADITYPTKAVGMNKNELKVGDIVGYRSQSQKNVRGRIIRINPKTVTLFVEPNQQWRVPYSMLYPIVDGEKAHEQKFIESSFS